MHKTKIVILGACPGGMMTAVRLQKSLNLKEAEIILINKEDYHYQTTCLHENAAGTLHHDRTRIPIRNIIDLDKVHLIIDKVVTIKPEQKQVKLEKQTIEYDILVIGLGFETESIGFPEITENAFSIKDINSARLIKDHIEYNFANYHNEENNEARLNFVIAGGGSTGIEFAGELADRVPELCREYDIEKLFVRVILLESSNTVLSEFEPELAEYAAKSLEARGVEIVTGAEVKECQPEYVIYEKNGEEVKLPTMTTIWAGGIRPNPILETSGFRTTDGKMEVTDHMRSKEYKEIFVVGESALLKNESGQAYSPSVDTAMKQAAVIAHNIKAGFNNTRLKQFRTKTKGKVVSLGNEDGIAVMINGSTFYGWKAAFMKQLRDNKYFFHLGGISLLMQKGKFHLFY
ncbi:NAD(P)/FAD-dependent oxidoreductase [Oceanobacillus piezotolerans]|uniref:NAD(P)/FAD-dependent oxidoreductase n=1 Tax=Oceanobacillus piezotolerans TaxID=2448030 RepID=A0A498DEZ5_9BACI|nr:NAD(P)/FAD-dependent oxidoreductase [Oceanobacillus piezotolerans]RLL46491.1 NAD(P)/FAD-dependent oxidoreductase [Oceanobacillus piezotolerans]